MELNQMPYMKESTGWQGYDFKLKKYVDMYEAGIVDSLPVVKNCVI
jgi:chaperonin GroEL (HSP60 family)